MTSMGSERPYLKNSIAQLEEIFAQYQSDIRILITVELELKHRPAGQAAQLHAKVRQALKTFENSVTGRHKSPAEPDIETLTAASAEYLPEKPFPQEKKPQGAKQPALPPFVDFAKLSKIPLPTTANEPQAIIATWIALEALSPQTYRRPEDLAAGNRKCVADFSSAPLPWIKGEPVKPKYQLYYQIVLGAIPMNKATEALIKAFGKDDEQQTNLREKAAIAGILVDHRGVPVQENGIVISSFAWALPLSLQRQLHSLGAWPQTEYKVVETLREIVNRLDEDGEPLPLDKETIARAYNWLTGQFELPDDLVEPPSFALRIYHYHKSKTPPEALLLNSFYIEDLSRALAIVESGSVPAGLKSYLGMNKPAHITDLLADKKALEQAVSPAMTPPARWPAPGGHPLVLLQQAAVNLTRSELAGKQGIMAVNGPPGTGKTTLLRDVVAASVVDRALAMSAFSNPEDAFSMSGQKFSAGETASFHLYTIASSLKGHEVLIASSNNKAVENVSRELPALKAIGRPVDDCQYFRSVADAVHNPPVKDSENNGEKSTPIQTWGLIAAVLGNSQNRYNFQKTFWWDEHYGFRLYLKAAKGDPVGREIKNPVTQDVKRQMPLVVQAENPPSPQAAKIQWRHVRDKFLKLRQEIDSDLKALEEVRQLCLKQTTVEEELAHSQAELAAETALCPYPEEDSRQIAAALTKAKDIREQSEQDISRNMVLRPGFFARLFHTQSWRDWARSHALLLQELSQARAAFKTAQEKNDTMQSAMQGWTARTKDKSARVAQSQKQLDAAVQKIAAQRLLLGERMVDAAFFAKGHEASNLAAPWLPDSLHRKREDLFIAALDVHRAFIDASAQKVLHNLSILMDIFSSGPPQDEEKRKLLGDLWSTLFMVIPVLSTTFASVGRMLGALPPGSIGWLLIDEAGQALPQAAVGAVMRAQRTIAVGDPLQIPPVVTLPERLNAEICNFFKIDKSVWSAPEASVQTIADRASRYQAAFRSDRGPRMVGIPLLVHRRCQEPMFGIANRIAYDGQMVHAVSAYNPGRIGAVFGPSAWFDVNGKADSKWCPEEGELVVKLLRQIAAAGITDPDLFLISPFRIVANELRRRLEQEKQLFEALGVDKHTWMQDRVGTIHTFQGREAESVILVLGAPETAQNGARSWAAGTPNIFNVAVSRAKQNLYIVGSYDAWAGTGHGREIAELERQRL